MTSWASLNLKVRLYVSIVVILAIPIFLNSLRFVFFIQKDYWWLILTVITLVTVPMFVHDPHVRSLVTVGDAYVISICMMFGIDTAIIANMLYMTYLTLLLKSRLHTPTHRIVFNIATAILNVQIYGIVFHSLQSIGIDKILIPTFGLALSFFLTNSFFIATAISLSTKSSLFGLWKSNYAPLAIDFLVSACAGAFIGLFIPTFLPQYSALGKIVGPILLAPFVGVIFQINRVNKTKRINAEIHLKEQEELYLRTVETLALAVDAKDQTTYGHIRRVRAYALGLARIIGVSDSNEMKAIETGSLLHDIGKLAIEDYILNKPAKLTKQEFEKMKVHSMAGDEILQQVAFPYPVAKYVRHHHERWDGTGYPDRLKGFEIPLGARILAIADAFDAIRSSRPYKSAFGTTDSVELLRALSGTSYDPRLVELFINHIEELEVAADEAAKNISELSFRKYFDNLENDAPNPQLPELERPILSTTNTELLELNEFCMGPARTLDIVDSLPIIARRIRHMVPYDLCIFFFCQPTDCIKAEYAFGENSELVKDHIIQVGKGISGWVAAYKKPILNTAPTLDLPISNSHDHVFCDALVVPIIHEGDSLGTISLYSREKSFYSQNFVTTLESAAEQISPLIFETQIRTSANNHSFIDSVTGVPRISHLSVLGGQILTQAQKHATPLSLIYLELKNYQHLVSLYGNNAGEIMLRKAAAVLRSELRHTDVLVRFGQYAFAALLPGLKNHQARRYVQRLQQQINSSPVNVLPANISFIDCHAEVASYPDDGLTLMALLESAQRNLIEHSRLINPQTTGTERNIVEFPPRP